MTKNVPHLYLQLPEKVAIQQSMSSLKDDQILALAKLMHMHLDTRPAHIKHLLKVLDPSESRLRGEATRAKACLRAWVGQDEMNAANHAQWAKAIVRATK